MTTHMLKVRTPFIAAKLDPVFAAGLMSLEAFVNQDQHKKTS